ncbi:hypothetical protein [Gandjariella thermophila]|uniref:ESX-1 secretion-associated protein n=1 Tax=Gandjariella thermophila TaxID=1931992 RepID=A0A4D4JBY4_9PSEU|nr:hypothetical protein [Gandjariella thermophila]GDY31373.1 hypothetical protein GTS_30060 [Gandjariella thermophila]
MPELNLDSVHQQSQAMRNLADLANSGGFGLADDAGQALLKAIYNMKDGLNGMRVQLDQVKQDAKLGTSPDAKAMIQRNKLIATGDNQSADYVLSEFDKALTDAEVAIKQAMRNYVDTETGNQRGINRAGA